MAHAKNRVRHAQKKAPKLSPREKRRMKHAKATATPYELIGTHNPRD